tara:strand:- start:3425 stop:4288 length:864 start_codon:yes stop_codon:yes gene_type:complete
VGLKEDVSDIITDITPTDTPMVSMIKTQKVHNRVYQYQTDALAAAASNAQVEGADPTMATLTATTMISGNTQILTKAFQISQTSDAVSTYGRAKETAYQLGRALKEIKRDLEYAFVGASNAAVTGNASGPVAREMDSADQLIDSSTTIAGGSNALTEAELLSAGQAVFNAGGDPSVFMIKPADAQIVAGFTGASGRYRNFNDAQKTLTNVIDLYVSPYGEYKVVLNRHQMTTHAFLLDPSMWRAAVLRPFSRTLLAKTGDSEKHFVVGEYGLMHMNPKGSGMINALT